MGKQAERLWGANGFLSREHYEPTAPEPVDVRIWSTPCSADPRKLRTRQLFQVPRGSEGGV